MGYTDISDLPAEWMSAELSGSMAKFPRARAARFWTVSRATFLLKISTKAVTFLFKIKFHSLWFFRATINFHIKMKMTTYRQYLFHQVYEPTVEDILNVISLNERFKE